MDNRTFDRIAALTQKLEQLDTKIDHLTKEMNGFRIDKQQYLERSRSITPGISPKIAFDSDGLVVRGMQLDPSDIPNLQISQITGLKNILDSVTNAADLKKIQSDIKNSIVRRGDHAVASATKINYDANGFVVSGSDLTPNDIPTLPMSKIDGLVDLIDIIESMNRSNVSTASDVSINPTSITRSGVFTKVSVDSSGRVVGGEKITVNDIPIDLLNRINQIESAITSLASIDAINNVTKSISRKVDSNTPISPGTYMKVTVDSKGLVTKGSPLTVQDLPEITLDDITGLKMELNKSAKYTDVIDLNDSVAKLTSAIQRIGDVQQLRSEVKLKADADQVVRMDSELQGVKTMMTKLQESLPSDMILTRLDELDRHISNIEGRISVLENRLES